jgi:hypothetical protein
MNLQSISVWRDFVDIFRISNSSCCPYSALKKLFFISIIITPNSAVFSFPNGSPLTAKIFTDSIRSLLGKHIGKNAFQIIGHFFRAAITAALANHPNLATDHKIMI